MLKDPIEGCFIITSDNLIFEVKGVIHPLDRVIAYLRYVPDMSMERRGYRKIYDLFEREDYLKTHFPHYLWYSQAHGRMLQSVPRDMIKSLLNPVDYLMYMRKRKVENSELAESTVNLADKLIDITGITKADIGITGSQLAKVTTITSDIDLVIYGEKSCKKFYDCMKNSFDQTRDFTRYSGDLLDAHVVFRWEKLNKYHSILRKIEREKVLQGIFDSYHFFIRLVKLPSDINQQYGTIIVKMKDICETECLVKDTSNSIFTPCEYLVESDKYPVLQKLISYRGRFTEQILSSGLVKTRGRLEDVTNIQTGDEYQQIVLGENSTDLLIPL